ncbi:hypothetical protein EBH_0081910 [Eimeria brunetti]|uniref:Uncharacterized protein n=1 Tax=Eimeria brunetti TaxID=51314 RepID=U6LUV3_9EIME|nr:hypothetical protein EBH_0081910 [Eimeria brunetti]
MPQRVSEQRGPERGADKPYNLYLHVQVSCPSAKDAVCPYRQADLIPPKKNKTGADLNPTVNGFTWLHGASLSNSDLLGRAVGRQEKIAGVQDEEDLA